MSETLRPARVVPPGRIIVRELEERGWSQQDLAVIMDRPEQMISEIVRAKKQITAETARQLGQALGTSADFWMNLESNYRLHLAEKELQESEIARRSRLFELAPVNELQKRGWLPQTGSLDALEVNLCDFLRIASVQDTPTLAANFRRSEQRGPEYRAGVSWVRRVERLAMTQPVSAYRREQLAGTIGEVLACSWLAQDVGRVPALLAGLGVHFVVVPHLPRTYLDGAALYLEDHPVVALTLRYNRVDTFWFTLLHELAHIVLGHPEVHLDQLYDQGERSNADQEDAANRQARAWLLDLEAFNHFVQQHRPRFSRASVLAFAQSQQRHPGIVLGQLMYCGEVSYRHMRDLLTPVAGFLEPWYDRPLS